MKLSGADRRVAAVIMAAGAAMVLCFAGRSTMTSSLNVVCREPPAAAERLDGERVDVNTAGLEELMTLPGIGKVRAQAILDDREANGPFRYPEDLIRVKGIGEGILNGILDQITAGEQESGPERGQPTADTSRAAQQRIIN